MARQDQGDHPVTTYRVGNHQPQNVYRDDQYIGVMFTADDAALVVEALIAKEPAEEGLCGAAYGSSFTCKRPPHTPDSKHAAIGGGGVLQWW